MRFTKMHGLGNDYLYVYGEVPENAPALSMRLSERHFGAGSDGMIWITPPETGGTYDFRMRIFNADGSEAMMCGNGIRCVGKYVFDKGLTDKTVLKIDTLSGVKTLCLHTENGRVRSVTVDMGKADCGQPEELPGVQLDEMPFIPVSVGNPHAVFFVDDAESVPLGDVGPLIEHHGRFPGGVNAEFAALTGENTLRMRVWERGSGITMACGTGACASAAAAVSAGLCSAGKPVTVKLDGGDLKVTVSNDMQITMEGPAETVYEGETED